MPSSPDPQDLPNSHARIEVSVGELKQFFNSLDPTRVCRSASSSTRMARRKLRQLLRVGPVPAC